MYQREFDQRLQQELPRAVLFYGENDYLIEHYISLYKERLEAAESMMTLYHDEYDFERARGYLSQSSLFGGINLLLIRREKKLPKKELDTLIELTGRNADNYLLFAFGGEARDAKAMQSSFAEKKGGVWVRFFEANPREAQQFLREEARKQGMEIDDYALGHLFTLLNGNLALCAKELEKLAILQRPVSSKDIDQMVYSTAPLAVERLLVDLFAKKPITETISKLLDLGEILRPADSHANSQDDLRLGQFQRADVLLHVLFQHRNVRSIERGGGDGFHRGLRRNIRRDGGQQPWPQSDHIRQGLGKDRRDDIPAQGGL